MARAEAMAQARAAIARGNLVEAYDHAGKALALEPGDDAAFLRVLALARMGDTDAALEQYATLNLADAPGTDPAALGARLLKDRAFADEGASGDAGFADRVMAAAHAYATVFARAADPFPGINAASLSVIAGEPAAGRAIAAQVLALLPAADTDFWGAATRAEALLLLGREAEAAAALTSGLAMADADAGARSTTRRQFERLSAHAGLDAGGALRALLVPPAVAFWCGHMFRADAASEAAIAEQVRAAIARHGIGAGYGALAAGSDIVIAETFHTLGLEVHVVLPFDIDSFRALSVLPAGANWVPRFDAVLATARSVRIASTVPDMGDPRAISHGSRVAMGLARLRARQLGAPAWQIAVWDQGAAWGIAGTAVDVGAWRATTPETSIVIAPGAIDRNLDRSGGMPDYAGPERATRAIVFADVVGFSKLGEAELPVFWRDVMGEVGAMLDRAGTGIAARNSWGDALFAIIDDAPAAARLVLDLQARIARVRLGDGHAGLRVGVHHGTVYSETDPITGRPNFYGTEVNRAARIEPITPPGAVYVTESFAAALAMDAPDAFDCFYVGPVPLAKAYGTFPMYRLTRR